MIVASHCYIALLHYPVLNKHGNIVTTAVANMDVHDIARVARTYDIRKYYIVTPIAAQRALVRSILEHWQRGYGAEYNSCRKEALERVCLMESFASVCKDVHADSGYRPRQVITGASLVDDLISYQDLKNIMGQDECSYLLVFGTGWGLAADIVDHADYRLAPVRGGADYNHLSVRSAAAVVLDRLFGR